MTSTLDLEGAIEALAQGNVVALPTDTVYGVAASLAQPSAVQTLFALKQRPATVALPVLVDSVAQIEELGVTWPDRARRLSDACWPGALTIVVGTPAELAFTLGSTTATAGFRCPNDELILALLQRSGPLAVTSANVHGGEPCESAAQILEVFKGRDELFGVLDDGPRSGSVSSVIDLSGSEWRVLREGALTSSELGTLLD
jgi:tRNA threonylcarbamoyl adenosine modification protein (Sua5/YciO/YrdC/YwlC family)